MPFRSLSARAAVFAAVATLPAVVSAAPLYTENFDIDHTANWTFNSSIAADTANNNAGNEANAFYDYSAIGIPSAPGSGGSTRGLKLEANIPGTGVQAAISASPTGVVLPTEYKLSAYVWQNANGPFPAGGSGSTQLTNMTVGASGNDASFSGGTLTGVQAAITGEGGSGQDWRVYSAAFPDGAGATVLPQNHAGVYAAGNLAADQNNTSAYYVANFPGVAPTTETPFFAQQNGTTQNGTPAFGWHLWEMTKTVNSVTWTIDGKAIASLPSSLFPASFGTNVAFGQMDINATSSTEANARALLFGLIDNVTVEAVPEPGSLSLLAVGGLAVLGRRRRNRA